MELKEFKKLVDILIDLAFKSGMSVDRVVLNQEEADAEDEKIADARRKVIEAAQMLQPKMST